MLLETIDGGLASALATLPMTPGTIVRASWTGDCWSTGTLDFGGGGGGTTVTGGAFMRSWSAFLSFSASFSFRAGSLFSLSSSSMFFSVASAIASACSSISASVFGLWLIGRGAEPPMAGAPGSGSGFGGGAPSAFACSARSLDAISAALSTDDELDPAACAGCSCGSAPSPFLPFLPLPSPFFGRSGSSQGSLNSSGSSAGFWPMLASVLALSLSFCCWLFSVLSYLNPLPPKPPHFLFFLAWPVLTMDWYPSASRFSFSGTSWPHCLKASTMSWARSPSSGWMKVKAKPALPARPVRPILWM
mmetsp:Transcript_51357/g.133618  ORF Transcript_51357/g.133618 Transcript_51357/m.133618 type:complete len:304 (-) Transcript_51357:924-1835(-)